MPAIRASLMPSPLELLVLISRQVEPHSATAVCECVLEGLLCFGVLIAPAAMGEFR
jgi:hypothetical protein